MAQQEQEVREHIDRLLGQAGWSVMDAAQASIEIDRNGVAPDQIRTIMRTFRDKLLSEIVPSRSLQRSLVSA